MTTQAKHTPTPWKVVTGAIYTQNDVPIALMNREIGNGTLPVERDENAFFIMKAVNSHDILKTRLRQLIEAVDNDMVKKYPNSFPGINSAIAYAKEALKQAEGV